MNNLPSSVIQSAAHGSMSQMYDHISTDRVLKLLEGEGYELTKAVQVKVRKQNKEGFQKHMLSLTRSDLIIPGLGQLQIALRNSHEGSSSFHLLAAMNVFLCANGMFRCTDKIGGDIRIRHVGYSDDKMIEALQSFTESLPSFRGEIQSFNEHHLTKEEQESFAMSAIEMKYDLNEFSIDPRQFLKGNRSADSTETLWGTLNVVQENLIQARHSYIKPKFPDIEPLQLTRRQRMAQIYGVKSRAVTAIDKNVELNRGLWKLAVDTLEGVTQ